MNTELKELSVLVPGATDLSGERDRLTHMWNTAAMRLHSQQDHAARLASVELALVGAGLGPSLQDVPGLRELLEQGLVSDRLEKELASVGFSAEQALFLRRLLTDGSCFA